MSRFALAALLALPIPSLEDVRKDAAEAPNARSQVPENDLTTLLEAPSERLEDRLPSLFAFSARAPLDAVSPDLVGECMWALETLLCRSCRNRNRSNDVMIHYTLKLATLYMRPDVECPDRAAEAMKGLFNRLRRTDPSWDISVLPSQTRLMYAVSLAKTSVDDDEAERILTGFLDIGNPEVLTMTAKVKAQLYLSRVLRRKGHLQDASVIESELVRWFKRNPYVFDDEDLASLFLAPHDTDQTDLVLTALGGPGWFQDRQRTTRVEQRRSKRCAHCEASDSSISLKKCGACKDIWYCSTGCQKANWPSHSELCKWLKKCKTQIETPEQEGDARQRLCQQLIAWSNWDLKTHPRVMAHALGIHRDATRGRTHIFYKQVQHDPAAGSLPGKFFTVGCGVFRLEDVLGTIEKGANLEKGKGREYLRQYFLPFETGKDSHLVPMLGMVNCQEGGPHVFVCKGASLREINQSPYDPNWMRTVEPREIQAPKKLLCWNSAKNAEHD